MKCEKPTVLGYMKSQPEVLARTLKNKNKFVKPFVEYFVKNDIKKIIFFGSGTSYNVSNIAAYYFKHLVNIDAEAQYPTVYQNYEQANRYGFLKDSQVLCVGISQSGTSISTINMLKNAKERGHSTLVITGNTKSEITKYVDVVTELLVGPELTPPETKGYTTSVISVYLWALEAAKATKQITEKQYEKHLADLQKLVDNFEYVVKESEAWYDRNKATFMNSDRIYVLGYGIDYATVLEGQLKIAEMFRYPIVGYEIEEFMHGPTPAITPKVTFFLVGSEEVELDRMLMIRKALLKYTDRVHVISASKKIDDVTEKDIIFKGGFNKWIAPLAYTVPMQFVAAKGAKEIGIDTNEWPFKEPIAHLQED